MAVSREDETISSRKAIDFFSNLHNQNSKLLLYTAGDHLYTDPRILPRLSRYPDLHINHFSHTSIPFAPNNFHYGQQGDYQHASLIHSDEYMHGAYDQIEQKIYDVLYPLGLVKRKPHELTYNPDFNFMAAQITQFIFASHQ